MSNLAYATASVRGYQHVLKDIPNQDAIKSMLIDDGIIIAIADGHGSPRCFRSDIGADFAVKLACDVLCKNIDLLEKLGTEEIKHQVLRIIESEWKKSIDMHIKTHPFNEKEVEDVKDNPMMAYGSTILCAVVLRETVLFLNIGDGSWILSADSIDAKNLSSYEWKCTLDNNSDILYLGSGSTALANETESLSMDDAYKYGNVTRYKRESIKAFMISTDGYINSFKDNEGYLKVLADLLRINEEYGIQSISKDWTKWLKQTTQDGSGDDISSAVVILDK